MVILKEITRYRDFADLKYPWNALLEKSDTECVFLSWEWVKAWWDAYGSGKSLFILLGYSRGALVGIAPFMIRGAPDMGPQVRSVEFVGSGNEVTPDHLGVIAAKKDKDEFIRSVFQHLMKQATWDVVRLRDMDEESGLPGHAHLFGRSGFRYVSIDNGICPYVRLPATWDAFSGTLSRQSRYNIRRKERSAEKISTLEFTLLKSGEAVHSAMNTLEELHKKRMSEKMLAGESLGATFWRFHAGVAQEFFGKGWLFLGLLKMGGEAAACQYAFKFKNKVSFYQSGIDPRYGRYGVGLLSTAYMIRASIEEGAAEYDFLRGNEEYKFHWTREFRRNRELIVWNRTLKASLPYALYRSRQFVKKVVKGIRTAVLPEKNGETAEP